MRKVVGTGMVFVFLACGCGQEVAYVIKAGKDIDPIVMATIKAPFEDERKLEKAETWREGLRSKRVELIAERVTKLMGKKRAGSKSKLAAGDASAIKARITAAKDLAYLSDKAATSFLMEQAVKDESKVVKLECIKALGQLEDYTAVPVLVQLLEDLDGEIAKAALDSLTTICRPVTHRVWTFFGTSLHDRKKVAHQLRRWWDSGGREQLAEQAKEG